jgi:hypothetical protein
VCSHCARACLQFSFCSVWAQTVGPASLLCLGFKLVVVLVMAAVAGAAGPPPPPPPPPGPPGKPPPGTDPPPPDVPEPDKEEEEEGESDEEGVDGRRECLKRLGGCGRKSYIRKGACLWRGCLLAATNVYDIVYIICRVNVVSLLLRRPGLSVQCVSVCVAWCLCVVCQCM